MKYIFILFTLVFIYSCGVQDDTTVVPFMMKNYVTDSTPLIGDVIEYHLEIKHIKDIKVNIPDLNPLFDELEIRNIDIKEEIIEDYNHINHIYSITTLSDSSFIIPSVIITYIDNGDTTEILTQEIYIKFLSTGADLAGDIREITDIIWVKYNYLIIIILFLLLLTAIIIGLIIYKKKYKKNLITTSEDSKYTPLKWAKIRLNKLNKKNYIENNLIKPYYFELTEIFKEFMEKIFDANITEMTTEEILEYLYNKKNKSLTKIRHYLNNTDLVKYAKYQPPKAEIIETTNKTEEIIEEIYNENLISKLDD